MSPFARMARTTRAVGAAGAAGAAASVPAQAGSGTQRTDSLVDDATVVCDVLAGDTDAFATLVVRHQESLYRFARSMGVPADTAQDLVQDTFVRAFTRLAQCRDAARLRSWLITILRNAVLDHARDVRRGELPLDTLPQDYVAVAATCELRGAVNEALLAVPELLREAFLLRHHHGYTYDEIAGITGAGESAVKMRVHRAREMLRALLGDDDVTDAAH